ncbi:MAG: Rrf2 family transcriptional regulator [Devosiaceae bacterium]|nr:Rrf2 family transcriptional regulator [Devosiaceae bacterium MH13]
MRLSKQTSYAIRILIDCAHAMPHAVRSSEIAERQKISEYNIQKLVAQLAGEGILSTARGRGGGIRLALDPADINLGTILRITEPTRIVVDCFGEPVDCAVRQITPVNRIFSAAYDGFVDVLDRYTLADLMKGHQLSPVPV